MPDTIQTPPAEVLTDLQTLSTDLDQKIPAKKLDKNLLIATWNIRAFGDLTKKWQSITSWQYFFSPALLQ